MEAVKKRAELEERIQALENEKTSLAAEVEALRAIPSLTEKASTLESVVSKLREEKKTLLTRANSALESRGEPSIDLKTAEAPRKGTIMYPEPSMRDDSQSRPEPAKRDSERPQDLSQSSPSETNQQTGEVEKQLAENQADDYKPKSSKEYIAPFTRQVTSKVGKAIVDVTQEVGSTVTDTLEAVTTATASIKNRNLTQRLSKLRQQHAIKF